MQSGEFIGITASITAAYAAGNALSAADLPDLIKRVHSVLLTLDAGVVSEPAPSVPTKEEVAASITYDRLVSFIDGKAYKSLKRHLTAHGMTPAKYRSRYGLPKDYPMVSRAYAQDRSRIAKQIQYGQVLAGETARS